MKMRELKLIAVGSSSLIADEIKSVIQSFLGGEISIETKTTRAVVCAEENAFYVCAVTQAENLSHFIPAEKLFVFDLRPTTKFFLDLAQIPANELVCIFNNRLPYTKILIDECSRLGINQLKFFPAAYDDMPAEEIFSRLQRANYIVGIECLTGEKVLLSEKYRPYLQRGVKIISGKRTASIPSSSKLLAGVAEFYYNSMLAEKNFLIGDEQTEILLEKICRTVEMLKRAVNLAVTGQVVFNGNSNSASTLAAYPAGKIDSTIIEEQLLVLSYIKQKIQELR